MNKPALLASDPRTAALENPGNRRASTGEHVGDDLDRFRLDSCKVGGGSIAAHDLDAQTKRCTAQEQPRHHEGRDDRLDVENGDPTARAKSTMCPGMRPLVVIL